MCRAVLWAVAIAFGFSLPIGARAQMEALPLPNPGFCDPLMAVGAEDYEDEGDDEDLLERIRRFDLEKSETLTSEKAILEALAEELWDPATGETIARNELCEVEPSYVVHWSELLGRDEGDRLVVLAKGFFQFRKDGSFVFVYNQRPYEGTWALDGQNIKLSADWLYRGEAVSAPVERVSTPVILKYNDGKEDTYDEEVFRVGWFRFMRLATTVKGQTRNCACQ